MSINADAPPTASRRSDEAKVAGHLIYNNIPHDPVPNTNPILGSSDALMESAVNLDLYSASKMTSVRRTFCLFVLFDLILMFILWVIYTQLIGSTGYKAFEDQVTHYQFKTSLFDTVMLSAVRFTILLLGYALFRSHHWWIVAISTAVSCGFLICKIFLFDFEGTKSSNNPLSYCLIIISFVLAWAETWFLDFKVLPHEKKLKNRQRPQQNRGYGSVGNRSHLSPDDLQSLMTDDHQFYSPLDTPEGSDDEGAPSIMSSQDQENIRLGKHCFEVLWSYVVSPESHWKVEAGTDQVEGIVHSMKVKGLGKVFRLTATVDMSPKELYSEVTFNTPESTSWNTSIKESKRLQQVDENTDVLYNSTPDIAGGVISSRDFVNVRNWGKKDGIYLCASMSTTHAAMPPTKNIVRGTNNPGGMVFKSVGGEPDKCLFLWYMNSDIKCAMLGWLPQKLIDTNLGKVLLDFIADLRGHVETMKKDVVS